MTQQRHKRYQCIRAFADGWKIEYKSQRIDEHWVAALNPSFHKEYEYRIVPDAEGWLPWYATEDSVCPVDGAVVVEICLLDGVKITQTASHCIWTAYGDETITRYRIIKQHKTPQPKRKKVRYLAYEGPARFIVHRREGYSCGEGFTRIPSLDLEVEE